MDRGITFRDQFYSHLINPYFFSSGNISANTSVKYTNELTRCYWCNDVFTISHDNDCSGRNYVLVYGLWGYCSI